MDENRPKDRPYRANVKFFVAFIVVTIAIVIVAAYLLS